MIPTANVRMCQTKSVHHCVFKRSEMVWVPVTILVRVIQAAYLFVIMLKLCFVTDNGIIHERVPISGCTFRQFKS